MNLGACEKVYGVSPVDSGAYLRVKRGLPGFNLN